MRTRTRWGLAALAACLLAGAGIAGANGFPGAYMYYDDNGALVGEQTFGCNPNQAWGVVTEHRRVRAGCGVSM
ncbi:hypothetical protein LDO26_11640 [Luteimonas sp. BDR2-5]|uniref:DUF6289 family protein n=1 Tax=Proluteimonas luteida TaxID=2878685 RepID=UPI001E4D5F76|nr:DUF6289 family protein [Luteimonas sp. BDR2-5]MCD9028859.1 hypothetical protein [Luteimonas sp. BDR2-5]